MISVSLLFRFCSDVVQMLFRFCSDFCSDFGSGGHFRSGLCSAQLGAPTGAVHSRETAASQIVSVVSGRRGPPRVTTTAHAHNSAHILHKISFLEALPGAPGMWPLGSRCAARLLRIPGAEGVTYCFGAARHTASGARPRRPSPYIHS